MSVETISITEEFEQKLPREIERKFMPIFPEALVEYRSEARPIEQFYLSHPSEPFGLRFREAFATDGTLQYTATLKDNGQLTERGIERMEVETPISAELYAYYKSAETPILRKLRAEPLPGVIIDFYDDGSLQLESEDADNWDRFVAKHGDMFVDITGDHISNNEWRAHLSFRRDHEGTETLRPAPDISLNALVNDILRQYSDDAPTTVHIAGRSGSGKSTIVRELIRNLAEYNITPVVVSTDDYHRGTTWLNQYNNGQPWSEWDAPVVYDTATMAIDLARLRAGNSIPRRTIDWTVCEPVYDGEIAPSQVIIIEGIYASSPDVSRDDELTYEMTTPLATCIGRRLLRDMRERPEFADPIKSLGYMLEQAEPAYRAQKY